LGTGSYMRPTAMNATAPVGYHPVRVRLRGPASTSRILSLMRDRALGETWATYLSAARRAAGMSKSELAKVAQVGRATVFRWEAGESRPEQAEIVARVADVLGVDLDEALAAAGLRPSSAPPERP